MPKVLFQNLEFDSADALIAHVRANHHRVRNPVIRLVKPTPKAEPPAVTEPAVTLLPPHAVRVRGIISKILNAAQEVFDINRPMLMSDRRVKRMTHPRQIAMALIYEHADKSMPEIGRLFYGRDHTTVLHAVQVVPARCKTDPDFAAKFAKVRELAGLE